MANIRSKLEIDVQNTERLGVDINRYAIINGTVFDSSRGIMLENHAVIIEDKKIRAVCSPDDLSDEIMKIDIAGKFLLPGLIDVHVHSEDWHAPLFLAKGITAVRDVGCELETVLSRREKWNSSHQAPRLVCTGPLIDNPGNTWPATTSIVHTPQESRKRIDYLVERGVDQIKTYAFLDWPCFEAALDQAHQHNMFVLAHLGKHVNAHQAIEAGLDELEHLSGIAEALSWERNKEASNWEFFKLWALIDLKKANQLIDIIEEKGTWMAVSRLVWLRLANAWDSKYQSHPQMAYTPGPLREYWETFSPKKKQRSPKDMLAPSRIDRSQQVAGMAIFTAELFRRDAKILIGTDAPFPNILPGFSFHDEIQSLLECGLSEKDALQAATIAGAQALQIDHLVGTVEAGKQADLIIVNGNPLEDMRNLQNIDVVIRNGQWVFPDDLLEEAAEYAQQAKPSAKKRFDEHY
jgi:imidazolonepropionase-like amidohydrolase